MTQPRHRRPVLILALALLVAAGRLALAAAPAAQTVPAPGAATAPLSQTIPVDHGRHGRHAAERPALLHPRERQPEDRAELRLVVNAGSVLEDDDQRGLAHFVEHMAFNGTKHFPEAGHRQLHAVDRACGSAATVNAYTSFDETVYMLQMPTDKPEVHRPGAAHPRGLGAQRVVRPGRDRQGARRHPRGVAARARRERAACRTSSSRCCSRARATPTGCRSAAWTSSRTSSTTVLKQFYTDWYRPDLMAVDRRRRLRQGGDGGAHQEALRAAARAGRTPRPRPSYPRADHAGHALRRSRPTRKRRARRVDRVQHVAARATRRPSAPTGSRSSSGCSAACSRPGCRRSRRSPTRRSSAPARSRGLFVRTSEATTLSALGQGRRRRARPRGALHRGGARRAVRLHGDGARSARRRACSATSSSAVAEKDNEDSAPLADEFIRNFTHGASRFPASSTRHALYQRFLPEITLAEVNALARTWMPDRNRVVVVSAPEKAGVPVPTEPQAGGGHGRGRRRRTLDALRRYGRGRSRSSPTPPSPAASSKTTTQERVRHHRVDAVERRQGRAEADDVQGGRDPVPRLQPGRHLARERQRLRRGRDRGTGRLAPAASARSARSISGKMLAGKAARRAAVHRRHGRGR